MIHRKDPGHMHLHPRVPLAMKALHRTGLSLTYRFRLRRTQESLLHGSENQEKQILTFADGASMTPEVNAFSRR